MSTDRQNAKERRDSSREQRLGIRAHRDVLK
jgi:hypothetical protein